MPSILIVEDSEYSRILLKQQLAKLGYEVLVASDGDEAWELVRTNPINMVITDWMMPKLSGLDLCRKIRGADLPRYTYIILLSVKADREDMVTGIEAGADNFIVKPCSLAQLRVMLLTAERVLEYERTLVERNQSLALAHSELKRGLHSTGQFHRALLPQPEVTISDILFRSTSRACEYATGDMFNYFPLDSEHVVFYLLDVAGHGVPAAMLSFTLSHFLSNVPLGARAGFSESTVLNLTSPAEVTQVLNHRFQGRGDDSLSFTIIYGLIYLQEKKVVFTQAGHPPLIFQAQGQKPHALGEGGFPVGYFDNVVYDEYFFHYQVGDRAFLYSDGVTECQNSEKQPFTINRLLEMIHSTGGLSLERALAVIQEEVIKWRGSEILDDDLSLLAMEFGPSIQN